jgi:hypothetical protein
VNPSVAARGFSKRDAEGNDALCLPRDHQKKSERWLLDG